MATALRHLLILELTTDNTILIIRQSPKHGQMCTLGSKNRRKRSILYRIIQLDIRDKDGEQDLV